MVRAPGGDPVAKMRVDYTSEDDTGIFSQLATMNQLQDLGIATMLIAAAEQRVRARGRYGCAMIVQSGVAYAGPAVGDLPSLPTLLSSASAGVRAPQGVRRAGRPWASCRGLAIRSDESDFFTCGCPIASGAWRPDQHERGQPGRGPRRRFSSWHTWRTGTPPRSAATRI